MASTKRQVNKGTSGLIAADGGEFTGYPLEA